MERLCLGHKKMEGSFITKREAEIVERKLKGRSHSEIASELKVSKAYVSKTLKRVAAKITKLEDSAKLLTQLGLIGQREQITLTDKGLQLMKLRPIELTRSKTAGELIASSGMQSSSGRFRSTKGTEIQPLVMPQISKIEDLGQSLIELREEEIFPESREKIWRVIRTRGWEASKWHPRIGRVRSLTAKRKTVEFAWYIAGRRVRGIARVNPNPPDSITIDFLRGPITGRIVNRYSDISGGTRVVSECTVKSHSLNAQQLTDTVREFLNVGLQDNRRYASVRVT